ncbi:MAG: sensor histidine kinase [Planctomycetota bacterium]|jgi:signal transduction histidine kinase
MTAVRQRLSADMAEVLGHELRNPLASAVTGVSLAYEMTDDGDPRSRYLRQALEDLTRVATLLTSYLELGRSGEPACASLDLVRLAREVAERYPSGQVIVVADRGDVRVRGDSAMLGRMLENLLDNALAAGARRAHIRLSCRGDRCILDVSDDGPGVDPEIRERMFRPFVSGCGSTGLGLTIVREIVEAHRGAITLLSTERGATFRSVFPSPCS